MIIAIDGPAAAGKGTLARRFAAVFGFDYLDTGLLYRAVARLVMDEDLSPDDATACTSVALRLRPDDLIRDDLRGETVGQVASRVSAVPGVRAALLEFQRNFAANPPGGRGAVLDGRDIGTVVCPEAEVKLWITADPSVRAHRRWAESGGVGDLAAITASIAERDAREASRAVAPMRPADGAVILDTSHLTINEVLEAAEEAAWRMAGASLLSSAAPPPGVAPRR